MRNKKSNKPFWPPIKYRAGNVNKKNIQAHSNDEKQIKNLGEKIKHGRIPAENTVQEKTGEKKVSQKN